MLRITSRNVYFAEPVEALTWLDAQAGSEKHFDPPRVLQLLGRMPAGQKVA